MKSTARKTRPKQTRASRARANDRRLLKKAERETAEGSSGEGNQPPGPAQLLRDAKAKLGELHRVAPPPPALFTSIHPASLAAEEAAEIEQETEDILVPMTLGEVCEIIGVDCKPERFAVTALETLGGQLDLITTLAETTSVGGYDAYRLTENIRQRMLLASRVTAWLESEKPLKRLPGVEP